MPTIEEMLIIVGLAGIGTLWVFAAVGMLQVGWKSIISPIADILKLNNRK